MSSRPRKRAAPSAYGLISAGAMRSSYNKQAVAVRKLSKRVRKLESDDEIKYLDTSLSFSLDSTAEVPATGGQLCLIVMGDDVVEREAWKVTCKGLQIRAKVTFVPGGASASGNSSVGHIYVILDRQCNGAAAAVTDVFTSTDASIAMRNMGNSARFKILHHWEHAFTSPSGVANAFCSVATNWEAYIPLKDLILKFDAATAAITSLTTNNIFIIAGTDGNSDDIITVLGTARLTFRG